MFVFIFNDVEHKYQNILKMIFFFFFFINYGPSKLQLVFTPTVGINAEGCTKCISVMEMLKETLAKHEA